MGKSFFDEGMKDKKAVFNVFFREAPDNNNWAVVSGVREVLLMIKGLGMKPKNSLKVFCRERNIENIENI